MNSAGRRRRSGCEAAMSQFALLDQVVQLTLQPVDGKGVACADGVNGDRAGLGEEAQQDAAARAASAELTARIGERESLAAIWPCEMPRGIPPGIRRRPSAMAAPWAVGMSICFDASDCRQAVPIQPDGIHGAALGDFQRGEVAQRLEEERQFFDCARMGRGRGVLQPLAHLADRFRAQQVGQVDVLEQILQQLAADGHRLQLALGLGRVPLVHVDADEVPQQALRHGRRRQRLDRRSPGFRRGWMRREHPFQVWPVHHLFQAVAVGLGDDREVLEVAHELQQVLGAQALQPEGRALAALAGQEQRPRRVLAKLRAKDRRVGQFGQDALARLVRPDRGQQVQRDIGVGFREAEEDAVVVALHLHVDARAFAQRAGQRQPPQPVDLAAKGRLDDQPLIAQRVVEDLDQNAPVRGDRAGVVELAGHVVDHVPGRRMRRARSRCAASPAAPALPAHPRPGGVSRKSASSSAGAHRVQAFGHGAAKGADALAQFVGSPRKIAAPEGHARGRARRVGDDHLVVGQLDARARPASQAAACRRRASRRQTPRPVRRAWSCRRPGRR